MFFRLLFLILAVMLVYHFSHLGSRRGVQSANAVSAPSVSVDAELRKNGYRIRALEPFTIEARVLSTERYRFDREADLAPVDLALGWGPMADAHVLEKIAVSQSARWYYWRASALPMPRREIEVNSANMHMIPATPEIEDRLKSVRKGEMVRVSGYLVEARADNGWIWRSSLTREDTGAGACEVVWVETLEVR